MINTVKPPKFSIITVCLNEPKLELTCKSIVNQTFQDFEWIVIDGGSDRPTLDIFEKYKYRMDYFVSEPDDGIYFAMNKGIERASGEWLNFMNAGDRFASHNILRDINDYTIKYVEYDVLHGIAKFEGDNRGNYYFGVTDDMIDKNYWLSYSLCQQAIFAKRNLWEKYGLFYVSEKKIYSDSIFYVKLFFSECKFKHINYTICCFDDSGASSTQHLEFKKNTDKYLLEFYTEKEIQNGRKILFYELRSRIKRRIL